MAREERSIGRRELLAGTAATLALAGCGGSRPMVPCALDGRVAVPPTPRDVTADVEALPGSDAFPLGVAAGDATPTHATLWTRYDGARALGLEVLEADGDAHGALAVTPADGGFVHARVGGLSAGRRYRYAFVELEGDRAVARSPVGALRAAIAPDALAPLTIGALSCVHFEHSQDALTHAATVPMDLCLALGDSSYNDGARTRCEFREAWSRTIGEAGWRALRAHTSFLATWDDHELRNDFAGAEIDPALVDAARGAFFDHSPIRRSPRAPDRIYREARWGRTAHLFVLDCRGERRPSTRGLDSVGQMLSRAQMRWLKTGLARSDAAFKLILTSVPISEFPDLGMMPKRHDRWEAYERQRREILEHVSAHRLSGVVWIAGDLHIASAGRVGARPWRPGGDQLEVLVGPGAQRINDVSRYLRPPQFDLALPHENVTTFELDPERLEVRVRWHGDDDVLAERRYDLSHGARLLRA